MRLDPPVPIINRQAIGPDRLADQDIAAGTRVVIAPWVIHRHSMHWEAPDLFDPSRFLPGARERMNRLAYLPFGFGPRACIAASYSMQTAVIVLATIVRSFRMELLPGTKAWPKHRITLRPRGGLPMILKHRQTDPGRDSPFAAGSPSRRPGKLHLARRTGLSAPSGKPFPCSRSGPAGAPIKPPGSTT